MSQLTPPPLSLAALNNAREAARRHRAEWLMAVHQELVTPQDLIEAAAAPESKPLLKLALGQVLSAQPGWGDKRTKRILEQIAAIVGSSAPVPQMTVGWLLDPRAGGRRYLAWTDTMSETRLNTPWPGFPFAPAPKRMA